MTNISFLILSNSYIINSGLEKIIGRFPGTEILASVYEKQAIQSTISKMQPDFVIIYESMLDDISSDLLDLLKENSDSKHILIKKSCNEKKDLPFFDAVIAITEKKENIIQQISDLINKLPKNKRLKSELTEREKDVIKLVALGFTNKEIADKLFISIHTVISHRKNITKKTDIRTASGMTAYAIIKKIIHPEDLNLQ